MTAASLAAAGVAAGLILPMTGCSEAKSGQVISVWTLALSPFFDEYITGLLREFEAAHPGVRVEWVDVPYEAIDRKLMAAAAAGRGPDVINLADRTFARFVGMGALADLTPLLPADTLAEYLPGAARIGIIGGKRLAVPWYLTTQAVLANSDLLSRGGLGPGEIPARWPEMLAIAGDFKRKVGRPLFTLPLGFESDVPMMLLSDGISPLKAGADGRLVSDLVDERVVRAIEPWVTAFRAGHLPRESATGGSSHLNKLFVEGDVAIINSGPNFLKRIAVDAPAIFRSTIVRPAITGLLGRAHIAVMTLGVTSQSQQPELAAALAAHLTSPRAQLDLCKRAVVLPSTASSLRDPLFGMPAGNEPKEASLQLEYRVATARAACAKQLPDAVAFTPAMESWPDLRRNFEDAFKRVLLDGADLRAMLAEVHGQWNTTLADRPAEMSAVPIASPVTSCKTAPSAPVVRA